MPRRPLLPRHIGVRHHSEPVERELQAEEMHAPAATPMALDVVDEDALIRAMTDDEFEAFLKEEGVLGTFMEFPYRNVRKTNAF